jgi:hypothetical protein
MLQGKILQQDQTLRLIQRALVNRQSAEAMFAEDRDKIILADIQRDRHDIGLWNGHIVDPHLAQSVKAMRLGRGARSHLSGRRVLCGTESGKKPAKKAFRPLV